MILRSRAPRRARIEIIPMIDVVFFLLVFFMMTSLAMTIYQGMPVSLPEAATGQRAAAEAASVTLTRQGETFLNREPVTLRGLSERIRALVAKDPALAVVINADREVAHARVVDVLDELRQTGVTRIAIAGGAGDAMTDRAFGWAVAASVGAHLVALAGAATVTGHPDPPPPAPVLIEVVRVAPPPPPPPEPARRPPPPRRPRVEPPPPRVEPREQETIQPARLIEDTAVLDAPPPRVAEPRVPTGPPIASRGVAGPPAAMPAGAGQLFSTGDLPLRAGRGVADARASGGGGGDGAAGPAAGPAVVRAPAGVTQFARPLGGYQTAPHYPESARAAGVEGVAMLRFVVQADGAVGTVNVEKSAGHPDLDRSAVEAVKTWRFEPARRGKEPVAVWVTLPVRFELTHR